MNIKWIYSNERAVWQEKKPLQTLSGTDSLELDGREYQKMNGFGACFNELGYRALLHLPEQEQEKLLEEIFSTTEGKTGFTMCRVPIGANDYSFDWYSLNETAGDVEMKHFSAERDKKTLIPYMKRAQKYNRNLKFFASPWSPPTWMKTPPVYNWGKLIDTPENLRAYALYFAQFIRAYAAEGIYINQVHVQNEPVANQKFPSCMWTGEELKVFIRDYLGPRFQEEGLTTEIWLGTINAPGCDYRRLIFDKWASEDYDYFANEVLSDSKALRYISGVSYQWGGKIAIQRTFESWWPKIRLMQTENECGFGDNTWEYARYNWTMLKHYLANGAESYMYWNLMLEPGGLNTWGDLQNAMITIDPERKTAVFNPDFYVMKHISAPVQDGAIRLGTKGPWAGDTLAFRNPDGSLVFNIFNPFKEIREFDYIYEKEAFSFQLEPQSINSIIFGI